MTSVEEIYRAHRDDVYRFALWLSRDPSEADDIVSESFLRLWGSLDELRIGTMKTYLLTIARSVYLSRRRRSSWYTRLRSEPTDRAPRPETTVEHCDELRALMSAVRELPEGERTALLMRIQHDLPYEEIARSLGISLSAAKVRVHRARLKLTQLRHTRGEPT